MSFLQCRTHQDVDCSCDVGQVQGRILRGISRGCGHGR